MDSLQVKNLAERIKKLRVKAGFTQEAFAKMAGVPYSTLTKIESGKIKNPSVFVMMRIADALAVSVDELVKGGKSAVALHLGPEQVGPEQFGGDIQVGGHWEADTSTPPSQFNSFSCEP